MTEKEISILIFGMVGFLIGTIFLVSILRGNKK